MYPFNSNLQYSVAGLCVFCAVEWRNISFKKIQSENFKIILNIPSSDLPLLESLEASVMDSLYPIDAMTWSNSTVFQAPRLRCIKLAGSILCDISILRVDWKRITSLTIWENTVVSVPSLFGVLLECKVLEELNLHVLFTPPFPQSSTLPTIRLKDLKRMSVTENASDSSLESFYAALGDLPSLHTLIFNQNPYQKLIAPDAPLAIYDLISASEKTLRRLQVDPRLMSKAGLKGCLQRCSRITYLSFMQGPPNLYVSSRHAAIVDDELLRALLSMRDLECFSCAVPPRFTDEELLPIL
ncbi:hypothetical protein D9613_012450 [Agrocybe pediades]|uniref:Uncharacterized protein n=1 Tax=Agrocybe pediades TaxID=84607 RepID=A0A8H4VN74_9AGAR|nr:hypothetical protein D9613_012450 [Agrocybe pediades]